MDSYVVSAVARSAAWAGPLRGWIEHRARELRDLPGIQRVRIIDQGMRGRGWRVELQVSSWEHAEPAVQALIADLELLNASPELERR